MPTITKYIQSDPIIFPFQRISSILHGFVRNVKNIGPYIATWILFIREVSELIPETHVWCSLIKRYIYRYFWKSVIFRKSHMSDCEHSCVFLYGGKIDVLCWVWTRKLMLEHTKKWLPFKGIVTCMTWCGIQLIEENQFDFLWAPPPSYSKVLPGTAGSPFSSMGFLSHTSPVHGVKNAHSGGPR